jgi:rubrerythrin
MDNILKKNEQVPEVPVENEEQNLQEDSVASEKLGYDLNDLAPEDLDSRWLRWKCLVCGYVYEGVMRLKECPKCGNKDPDKFEDAD